MKKTIITCITCFFLTSLSFSQMAQEKLPINVSKSNVHWYGYYTFYFGGHDGDINFKEGYFLKMGDVITGGEFVIDMNSITSTDIENPKAKKSLVNHLKNEDFFNTPKHPEAKLVITGVKYHDPTHMQVVANLTIKNVTHSVKFQAEVNFEKKQMTTKFKIDRMRWGVNYNSKMRDGAISDAIGFDVVLSL